MVCGPRKYKNEIARFQALGHQNPAISKQLKRRKQNPIQSLSCCSRPTTSRDRAMRLPANYSPASQVPDTYRWATTCGGAHPMDVAVCAAYLGRRIGAIGNRLRLGAPRREYAGGRSPKPQANWAQIHQLPCRRQFPLGSRPRKNFVSICGSTLLHCGESMLPVTPRTDNSATPRCAPARIALHASAVAPTSSQSLSRPARY